MRRQASKTADLVQRLRRLDADIHRSVGTFNDLVDDQNGTKWQLEANDKRIIALEDSVRTALDEFREACNDVHSAQTMSNIHAESINGLQTTLARLEHQASNAEMEYDRLVRVRDDAYASSTRNCRRAREYLGEMEAQAQALQSRIAQAEIDTQRRLGEVDRAVTGLEGRAGEEDRDPDIVEFMGRRDDALRDLAAERQRDGKHSCETKATKAEQRAPFDDDDDDDDDATSPDANARFCGHAPKPPTSPSSWSTSSVFASDIPGPWDNPPLERDERHRGWDSPQTFDQRGFQQPRTPPPTWPSDFEAQTTEWTPQHYWARPDERSYTRDTGEPLMGAVHSEYAHMLVQYQDGDTHIEVELSRRWTATYNTALPDLPPVLPRSEKSRGREGGDSQAHTPWPIIESLSSANFEVGSDEAQDESPPSRSQITPINFEPSSPTSPEAGEVKVASSVASSDFWVENARRELREVLNIM